MISKNNTLGPFKWTWNENRNIATISLTWRNPYIWKKNTPQMIEKSEQFKKQVNYLVTKTTVNSSHSENEISITCTVNSYNVRNCINEFVNLYSLLLYEWVLTNDNRAKGWLIDMFYTGIKNGNLPEKELILKELEVNNQIIYSNEDIAYFHLINQNNYGNSLWNSTISMMVISKLFITSQIDIPNSLKDQYVTFSEELLQDLLHEINIRTEIN